ncbi:hypothetical protein FOTG_18155 [Fusarium oxysporum f. sp. vasinfectum 25433]|uniref:Uncharacterized protein n=1 Tax=Fusarium oxysporum f. sp. vasinfectum 25433 TaxID=1089449 RepID=X0KIR6_FUSOX|nr:hypothetical protein FOTG_18155 [Fusarium oxysporum f. sp. vasinfectum 25433]
MRSCFSPLFSFLDFHFLFSTEMGSLKIPPEHVYCIQAGKKHHELFTTTYVAANYCGHCGLANPFRPQTRARSKTPALPGPYDEVVEVEDSPPPRPVSPASQLLRDRSKPMPSIGVGRTAQQLPVEMFAAGAMSTRARIPPPQLSSSPQFTTVASAASRAIQNSKANTRKPTRHRTGYQDGAASEGYGDQVFLGRFTDLGLILHDVVRPSSTAPAYNRSYEQRPLESFLCIEFLW